MIALYFALGARTLAPHNGQESTRLMIRRVGRMTPVRFSAEKAA